MISVLDSNFWLQWGCRRLQLSRSCSSVVDSAVVGEEAPCHQVNIYTNKRVVWDLWCITSYAFVMERVTFALKCEVKRSPLARLRMTHALDQIGVFSELGQYILNVDFERDISFTTRQRRLPNAQSPRWWPNGVRWSCFKPYNILVLGWTISIAFHDAVIPPSVSFMVSTINRECPSSTRPTRCFTTLFWSFVQLLKDFLFKDTGRWNDKT